MTESDAANIKEIHKKTQEIIQAMNQSAQWVSFAQNAVANPLTIETTSIAAVKEQLANKVSGATAGVVELLKQQDKMISELAK